MADEMSVRPQRKRWLLLLLLASLAGCVSAPPRTSGGYYLDDGPPEAAVVDVDAIADAVPKAEPIRASTTKPYTALGMRFIPMTRLEPYRARGRASWYGRRYHGKATASGEDYDMLSMTAAHPTLPIPSYVRVTHLSNGRQVVVRVNDRGPFHPGRLIDLSYVAALKLDLVTAGGGDVEVELILPGETQMTAADTAHRLQLGAYGSIDNARSSLERLKTDMPWLADKLAVRADNGMYRIVASPFSTRNAAVNAADRIERELALRPLLQTETRP